MIENQLVSVIIPVYNGEAFLAEAIESVIAQTYQPIEIVVVDDGSTDESAEVAQAYKEVQYIYQENSGVAAARNTGLSATKGSIMAFQDADDVWVKDKLKIQVQYLLDHPEVDITIPNIKNFLEGEISCSAETRQNLLEPGQIPLGSIVAHKKVFDQIGGFDIRYECGSDFEWHVRARNLGVTMKILPDVLLHRRIHASNISFKSPAANEAIRLKIFKESMMRRRSIRNIKTPTN
jgi:glycosyltransferase involved in cell wall biosynthesis